MNSEVKPLLDKLGVERGQKVALVGLDEVAFAEQLEERGAELIDPKQPGRFDHVFVYMDSLEHTFLFGLLRERIRPAGSIWAIYPKGNKEFNGNDVRNRGLEAGVVDVKVVRFSETLSALKFVLRLEDR